MATLQTPKSSRTLLRRGHRAERRDIYDFPPSERPRRTTRASSVLQLQTPPASQQVQSAANTPNVTRSVEDALPDHSGVLDGHPEQDTDADQRFCDEERVYTSALDADATKDVGDIIVVTSRNVPTNAYEAFGMCIQVRDAKAFEQRMHQTLDQFEQVSEAVLVCARFATFMKENNASGAAWDIDPKLMERMQSAAKSVARVRPKDDAYVRRNFDALFRVIHAWGIDVVSRYLVLPTTDTREGRSMFGEISAMIRKHPFGWDVTSRTLNRIIYGRILRESTTQLTYPRSKHLNAQNTCLQGRDIKALREGTAHLRDPLSEAELKQIGCVIDKFGLLRYPTVEETKRQKRSEEQQERRQQRKLAKEEEAAERAQEAEVTQKQARSRMAKDDRPSDTITPVTNLHDRSMQFVNHQTQAARSDNSCNSWLI